MKKLTLKEKIKIKDAIDNKQINDEIWFLLNKLFENNEYNLKRATDLSWQIEDLYSAKEKNDKP